MLAGPLLVLAAAVTLGAAEAARAAEPLPESLEGYYRAEGITTEQGTDRRRPIRGTLLVTRAAEGGGYVLRFSFKTKRTTPGGSLRADLLGTGDAHVEGEAFVGETETQVIVAAIPGVDPQFAFIPGYLGPRIRSHFRMRATDEPERFDADIETVAAPGFEYAATRTRLEVERISRETPEDERLPLPVPYDQRGE